MSDPKPAAVPAYRLAFRSEGDFVNCYFAPLRTMDGAILVSSMRRSILETDPVLFEDWKMALQLAFDRQNAREGAPSAGWTEHRAPEHERTGEA